MPAGAIVGLGIGGAFALILAVGGVIADYILPHIPVLENWIDSLPLEAFEEEDDSNE